jgi:hypothetical protein
MPELNEWRQLGLLVYALRFLTLNGAGGRFITRWLFIEWLEFCRFLHYSPIHGNMGAVPVAGKKRASAAGWASSPSGKKFAWIRKFRSLAFSECLGIKIQFMVSNALLEIANIKFASVIVLGFIEIQRKK